MNAVVFQRNEYQSLRIELLRAAPLEAATILIAGPAISESRVRLLVREYLPADRFETQAPERVVIPPGVVAEAMRRARQESFSLVFAHTHPFSDTPSFSPVDDEGELLLMKSVLTRLEGRPQASIVIGREGFDARLRRRPEKATAIERMDEVGSSFRRHYSTRTSLLPEFAPWNAEALWDRNVRAFGLAGQSVLGNLTVGIVGLGGIGSLVAQQLAHLGVRSYVLLDPDVIESTNLNRVVGSAAKIGAPKVDVATMLIRSILTEAKVKAVRGGAHRSADGKALLDTDVIFCCTDTQGSRAVLNQLAYQYLIPTIDTGVRIDVVEGRVERITGRIQMLAPGLGCLVCQELLDPQQVRRDLLSDSERAEDPYIVGDHEPQPAVISINGIVASHAVTMMLGAFTGLPLPARHQVYIGERGVVRAAVAAPRPECIVCSLRGALARGDSWRMSWRLT
jgi:molybdopterin-synthase adenylyltransferase